MKNIKFLLVGKNKEILDTLKRIIENNDSWQAEILSDAALYPEYLQEHLVDIVLLSSGLSDALEKEIKEYIYKLDKGIRVIDHYGGGSGLLKNEVYQLFPGMHV